MRTQTISQEARNKSIAGGGGGGGGGRSDLASVLCRVNYTAKGYIGAEGGEDCVYTHTNTHTHTQTQMSVLQRHRNTQVSTLTHTHTRTHTTYTHARARACACPHLQFSYLLPGADRSDKCHHLLPDLRNLKIYKHTTHIYVPKHTNLRTKDTDKSWQRSETDTSSAS